MVTGHSRAANALNLYRNMFDQSSRQLESAERTEVTVSAVPGEQVSGVRVLLRSVDFSAGTPLELFHISSVGGASLEITGLIAANDSFTVRAKVDSTGTTILAQPKRSAASNEPEDVIITFDLWEACEPLEGVSPYLHSTLRLGLSTPFAPNRPLLLTLSTPSTSSPRSTQGNFVLAYPSRLENGRRLTNIYFRKSPTKLAYRFSSDQNLTTPWLHLGRVAVASMLVFVVAVLATQIDEGDRFTALIAIFVATAGVLWDFSRDIAAFSVYNATRSSIQGVVLATQVIMLILLSGAVLGVTTAHGLLPVVGAASLVFSLVLCIVTVAALIAHVYGFWQQFVCDHEGCTQVFRWRRTRPECHFTGRVFCENHSISICSACPHGSDLRSPVLYTVAAYGTVTTPCGAVTVASP